MAGLATPQAIAVQPSQNMAPITPSSVGPTSTTVTGFTLRDLVPAGFVERESFRVNGPSARTYVLQYRPLGGTWSRAHRAETAEGRGVVRLRVDPNAGGWLWHVRRSGAWEAVARTDDAMLDWRVRLPAAGDYAKGRSRPERAVAHVPTSSPTAPRTGVRPETARQVVLADRTTGVRGDFRRFQWSARQYRWLRAGSGTAVFGRNGVVPAAQRVQGSNTTPAGTFGLLHAFGAGDPGTEMTYRPVTNCSYWVLDPSAGDYNRWRESCSNPPRSGEHLLSYVESGLYHHAVVTDYNYADPIRSGGGSGGAIFLHYASAYTGGCVGVTSMAELTRTVQWLDPARNPVLVVKR